MRSDTKVQKDKRYFCIGYIVKKKILVCITPQSNSKRLIEKGNEVCCENHGELHILHVEKGNNILITNENRVLLQQLFIYASELGATVHGLCGEDVFSTIKNFIKEEMVTHLVLGAPVKESNYFSQQINERIKLVFPYIDILILEREEKEN